MGGKMIKHSQELKKIKLCILGVLSFSICSVFGRTAYAASVSTKTDNNMEITASGRYQNWDGVTNVVQFKNANGNLCYAVDSDNYVTVYLTNKELSISNTIALKKQHPLFGTVISDSNGNYYLITGEENAANDTSIGTVFISKYDSAGNHIKTIGDNGSSSLESYYDDSFYTKNPFESGNCDAAISEGILTVNYSRRMYNGHQSNSVFSVDIEDMSKVNTGSFYQSHSFAQRVVSVDGGFVYMGEGDCFDRAFTANIVKMSDGEIDYHNEENIFDFWVEDGAYDAYDMFVVNNNFAHMGGLAALSDGKVAFVGQSAQSLNSNAKKESEEIFLQIFDPFLDLSDPDSYITTGTRSGLAGNNGRTSVTNYGVKWLTSYGTESAISDVQVVATNNNEIVILYELTSRSGYQGVYFMVLDEKGNVIHPAACFSPYAILNPCEMPVCDGGMVYWIGNRYSDSSKQVYIYSLDPSVDYSSVARETESNAENNTNEAENNINEVTNSGNEGKSGNDSNTSLINGTYNNNLSSGSTDSSSNNSTSYGNGYTLYSTYNRSDDDDDEDDDEDDETFSIGDTKTAGKGLTEALYVKTGNKTVRYDETMVDFSAKKAWIPKKVKIEGTVYKVTSIGKDAFSGYDKLTSVVIGKNITKISAMAFEDAPKLVNLTINSRKLKKNKIKDFLKKSNVVTIYTHSDKVNEYQKKFRADISGSKKKISVLSKSR